ncbi:N-acetylmuramoyl-L-alanine amidase [Lactiplantibacillus mudanjiangensis]|uniref:N-acetylmuramoyl-L-alanine amidase [Lactobacillus curieae] n=1 Tax=Lactiplantibacillus mudanjiangensis TaxID=1296538 RepID=A0A660E2K3_9LACO|nr:N-acetylmuramoyl-L-alanine amidase [Lactiplantibacillus mudanjiangensis]VDG25063.1 N-acetylmuramoyl-L-alanine amidase [Lactobacillus curieae] [Lactiplantibacillus mudanjiangensis]VDG29662.1 N-acetylmuramoyl-L-alanine amidase [Lactobacillus curieae] [Lactiplantibacillus mudanjiangensis]
MKTWQANLLLGMAATTIGLVATNTHGPSAQAADSVVNTYINNNHLQPASITSSIWNGFPKNAYRNGVGKPEGVAVHETANPNSTIYNEIAYMKNNYQNAFVHTFIDAGKIINIANTNYLAWGSGYYGNQRFVQFEQVEVHSKAAFASEVNNAAYYTAYILKQYNLQPDDAAYDGKGTVWSHGAISTYLGGTDHTDPKTYYANAGKTYFGQAYTFAMFYQLVKQQYDALGGTANATTNTSSSSAASSSTPTATTDTSSSTTATTSVKPQFAKVSYYKANGGNWANLSANYRKYRAYNHVKGSQANVKQLGWGYAYTGRKVYIDMRGVKAGGSTWYRIRYSKATNAKRYWVYGKALSLAKISYTTSLSQNMTVKSTTKAPLRNHVLSSPYLSKNTGSAADFAGQTVTVNAKAVKVQAGKTTTWYRFKGNQKSYWVVQSALQ